MYDRYEEIRRWKRMNLVVCKEDGTVQELVGAEKITVITVDDSISNVLKFKLTILGDKEYLESVRKGAYFYDIAEPEAVVNITSTILHEAELSMTIFGSASRESLINIEVQ